jgi:hypothetical protein
MVDRKKYDGSASREEQDMTPDHRLFAPILSSFSVYFLDASWYYLITMEGM